jgi:subtilisin
MKNRISMFLVVVLVIVASLGTSPAQAASTSNGYIIVFKDSVNVRAAVPAVAQAHGLQVGYVYESALKGMSAVVPAGRMAALEKDPRVAYVVEDMLRTIDAQTVPTGIQRIFADTNANLDIDATDDFRVDVDVAVIDTGVDFQHPDLNTVGGVNCSGGGPFRSSCTSGGDDDHYHGTHVAGTIGAIDNGIGVVGVAPGARIWAVKVLNSQGSGYTSWIVAGIDWVAFAVAAGNIDDDANNYSPAAFNNVLSVSALADFDGEPGGLGSPTCRADQDDTLADFSNWGAAVDIAAPGVCILSTFPIEQGEYGTISGTSMASPHVAGALALLASRNNPSNATDVNNLYSQVVNAGNLNWTDDSGDGTKERLLDVSNSTLFNPVLISGSGGGGGGSFTLNVRAYKVQGNKFADLTWSGATSTNVDVYRNGAVITTTANDGAYTDGPLGKGGGSATYQVCQAETSTCSNTVTVSW